MNCFEGSVSTAWLKWRVAVTEKWMKCVFSVCAWHRSPKAVAPILCLLECCGSLTWVRYSATNPWVMLFLQCLVILPTTHQCELKYWTTFWLGSLFRYVNLMTENWTKPWWTLCTPCLVLRKIWLLSSTRNLLILLPWSWRRQSTLCQQSLTIWCWRFYTIWLPRWRHSLFSYHRKFVNI